DPSFETVDDVLGGVQLRPPRTTVAASAPKPVAAPRHAALDPGGLAHYLGAIERTHGRVRMIGFGNRARVHWTLDDIFVPLDVVIDREVPGKERLHGFDELRAGQERLTLTAAFRRARQLGR